MSVTFFEISGPDPSGLRDFYGTTLGLALENPDDNGYAMVSPAEGSIPGAVWNASDVWGDQAAYAIPYVQVADVAATVAAATAAGARVVVAPREHGPTISAHLLDPAGNRVGVYEWATPAAG